MYSYSLGGCTLISLVVASSSYILTGGFSVDSFSICFVSLVLAKALGGVIHPGGLRVQALFMIIYCFFSCSLQTRSQALLFSKLQVSFSLWYCIIFVLSCRVAL